MIYKHAISTVVPSRDVRLPLPEIEGEAPSVDEAAD
jgi:host factor-I protein